MNKSKEYPLVEFTWYDACQVYGCSDENILAHPPTECKDIGYLVHIDKHWVVLKYHQVSLDNQNDYITIPRAWGQKIRILK